MIAIAPPKYRKLKPEPVPGWQRPLNQYLGGNSLIPFPEYADNPVDFIEVVLGTQLTPEQRQLAESVRDNAETNVPAGHGLGKTRVAACIALWWTFAVGGRFISTAPTNRQVTELLWGEIRSMYDAHAKELGGERGMTFIRLTEQARGVGYAAADRNLDSFQGAHAEHLLIIEDEANGISDEIDEGASSCLTGSGNRMLRIGNPSASGTAFEKSCEESCIRLPVWSHPNVAWAYAKVEAGENKWIHRLRPEVAAKILDENGLVLPQELWPEDCPRDVISGAVSIGWIENIRRKYGEGSAYWLGRVEAIFPQSSGNSIIPRDWFDAARARYDANPKLWDDLAKRHKPRYGLDVGDGGDPHALARWQGPVLYSVVEEPTMGDRLDISRAADFGWKILCEKGGVLSVDRIGVGAGALSEIKRRMTDPQFRRQNRLNGEVIGCNYGGSPEGAVSEIVGDRSPYSSDDTDDFVVRNLKADYFMALREAFRAGEVAIAPLGEIEDKVAKGFAQIFYEETSTGVTQIEDKKKTRKRLRRSPDPEDAIVMAFNAKPEKSSFANYW
jgi:hypothetical protein